ncbi:hypothetical protein QBC41DRAFT_310226 [Cercophora samala]|uniref:Uncharacterized protein n=1 Tax=Cercophora samala TaxID=330535 RepID=A0AA39ZMY1_9PEZI|nr:hypothetical protein QBC41DRAFT_310226 [Cercophora samala]
MVWPFVQLVNFRFVMLEHRVVVVNTILLGWNCAILATLYKQCWGSKDCGSNDDSKLARER